MHFDQNHQAFFALVKAGLWEQEVYLSRFGKIDFHELYRIAEEQSVVGLVAAGIEHVTDVKVPQEVALTFVGTALQLEQQNSAMNSFLANLITKMRGDGISSLLVKGQGIAQCYERPLWRASGDVDLLLSNKNYQKANTILSKMASSIDEENHYNQHIALTIDGWPVELHGTLRSGLWTGIDCVLDKVQRSVFYEGKVRSWMNGNIQVFLPRADEDVVYVFSHILQHFFKEGIGLRQLCDWCRILYRYHSELDLRLLESRIRNMGLMTEWRAFAALAVNYLGMPSEAMPMYSSSSYWSKKADKVMQFVLETGNFGHNRDYSYLRKYPYVIYKAISAWKHIVDFGRYFVIFPLDAIKVTWNRMCLGISVAMKGRKHE